MPRAEATTAKARAVVLRTYMFKVLQTNTCACSNNYKQSAAGATAFKPPPQTSARRTRAHALIRIINVGTHGGYHGGQTGGL